MEKRDETTVNYNYLTVNKDKIPSSDNEYFKHAATIESGAYRFYNDLSYVMKSRRKGVGIFFEKMAAQNLVRKEKIESIPE